MNMTIVSLSCLSLMKVFTCSKYYLVHFPQKNPFHKEFFWWYPKIFSNREDLMQKEWKFQRRLALTQAFWPNWVKLIGFQYYVNRDNYKWANSKRIKRPFSSINILCPLVFSNFLTIVSLKILFSITKYEVG